MGFVAETAEKVINAVVIIIITEHFTLYQHLLWSILIFQPGTQPLAICAYVDRSGMFVTAIEAEETAPEPPPAPEPEPVKEEPSTRWECIKHQGSILTLKVLNFWKFTSYCSLKPLWSDMGEVVLARISPTLHPPSPPTVHQLLRLAL